MRGEGSHLGRFDSAFEMNDIHTGISSDLTSFVGNTALWYVYISTPHVDPIYGVGSSDGFGRTWSAPLLIPVTRNLLTRSSGQDEGLGFYPVDSLHLTINSSDIVPKIPDIVSSPDAHIKDRVLYDGQIYRPINVQPRGVIGSRYALVVVDFIQESKEEMVNDPQFQSFNP